MSLNLHQMLMFHDKSELNTVKSVAVLSIEVVIQKLLHKSKVEGGGLSL